MSAIVVLKNGHQETKTQKHAPNADPHIGTRTEYDNLNNL